MQFFEGRIELNDSETATVNRLLENHKGNAALTRRDPGESGPVILEVDGKTWEINEEGKTKEVSN